MRPRYASTPLARGAAWVLGISLLVAISPATATAQAGCLERAAEWANVHPTLLRAIAWVESAGNPSAIHWNRNGTYDVGLMQINSWWYHRGLASIWERLGDPCVNAAVGSWVLKHCVDEYGYTWDAIGCYHAGAGWNRSPKRNIAGQRYIRTVQTVIAQATIPANSSFVPLTAPANQTTMSIPNTGVADADRDPPEDRTSRAGSTVRTPASEMTRHRRTHLPAARSPKE